MQTIRLQDLRLARLGGPEVLLFLVVLLAAASWLPEAHGASADSSSASNHQDAMAALADVKAAIGEIVQANDSYSTDRNFYHRQSQRAINAIEGVHGTNAVPADGVSGDPEGAIGHLDALLHRDGKAVWATPLDGVEANLRAAVAYLLDANHSRELNDFQIAASRALGYLEIARGRPTDTGALGGIEGALANTVLGVPDGAATADACAAPTSAPSYGVHGGWLAWVAVPADAGTHVLAENPGGNAVTVQNGVIVLPTAAALAVSKACSSRAAATSLQATQTAAAPSDPPSGGEVSALYTKAQAESGSKIFANKCVACHGADLQGTAAPSVAGTDFLTTAQKNGWTLEVIRYVVTSQMPFNSPGSLSPAEYADVLAFLLASNCYPAGSTPFPVDGNPAFANIKLAPVPGAHPAADRFGVCPGG
jgi:mono/diheme cytochrome c family protein